MRILKTNKATQHTIFLIVNHGFSSRYLLRTEIFETLKNSGARIVILSPNGDEEYFKKEFEDENVFIEPLDIEAYQRYYNKFQGFLKGIRLHSTNAKCDNSCVEMRYENLKRTRSDSGLLRKLYNRLQDLTIFFMNRYKFMRRALVTAENRLFTPDVLGSLFEKYHPEKLAITSLGVFEYDHLIMREAKKHGAKVISVILGFDNTSSKGIEGAFADYAVAWSETMRSELIGYHDFNPARIYVGGVAHFDNHFNEKDVWTKEKFYCSFNLDPQRKTIFYALKAPKNYPWNPVIVEALARAIEEDKFVKPCQLLVRVHPISFKTERGNHIYQKEIEQHHAIGNRYSHISYANPHILSEKLNFDMPAPEMAKVTSILKYSDVFLSYFSTMMLEASVFDLPTVNVALHAYTTQQNVDDMRIMEVPYIKRILATGGVRSPRNDEELIETINVYLKNPSSDSEGRRLIRDREVGGNAGMAGKAIGTYILEL